MPKDKTPAPPVDLSLVVSAIDKVERNLRADTREMRKDLMGKTNGQCRQI